MSPMCPSGWKRMTPMRRWLQETWRRMVIRWDLLWGRKHYRCIACGSMDDELDTEPCVLYGQAHHDVPVDRYGNLLEG